jgi:Zn-dependent protease with chaperone function
MAIIASYWWLWLILGIVTIVVLIISGVVKQLGIKNAFATTDKNCINPENHSAIMINSWQKITLAIITVGAWILFFISMGAHSRKNPKN